MILPFMEQQPLYNSINFNLSVAFHANDTCSLTALTVYLCPSDPGPSVVPVFEDPPDPANPGNFNATHIVDTLSRGNYVGMYGIGEICSQSVRSILRTTPAPAHWASTRGFFTATARRRSPP